MTRVGYARVSTLLGQSVEPQVRKLREAGCDVIFSDEGQSGAKASRPEWDKCLASLQRGDTLVAVRLDRFGRSVAHLLKLSEDLQARGIDLVCTDQPVDTTTAVGRLVFTILAAVAEFERSITTERIHDGLAVARANGKTLGAPRALSDAQLRAAVKMRAAQMRVPDIAATLGVGQSTLYRALSAAEAAAG
jgi:DNA invertase Pin-like site-specific DNA recombinase